MVSSHFLTVATPARTAAALYETMVRSHQWDQWVDPGVWDPWAGRAGGASTIEYVLGYHDNYEHIFSHLSHFTQKIVVTSSAQGKSGYSCDKWGVPRDV